MARNRWWVAALFVLAACSDDDEPATTACVEVTNPTLTALPGVSHAVEAEEGRWFVSNQDGATWLTRADPRGEDGSLTLPMNAAARDASEVGVDVAEGAPVYGDYTDDDPAADASRDCAG